MDTSDLKLIAKNLDKSYSGRKVVSSFSIEVGRGEVVGLLGPNGAGKTTSFYMMVGLVKAENGNIFLNNEDITKFPINKRAKLGISYLPQEASVFRDLSVEANIYAALEIRKVSYIIKKNLLENLITDFGLNKIRKSLGRSLSGGERRRVEIARSLAIEPSFILLDEPFAGVDPLAVIEIQNVIRTLKEKNIGILITDHNVRETLNIVDRAYVMNNGKVIVSGYPDDIINNEEAKKFYLGDEFSM